MYMDKCIQDTPFLSYVVTIGEKKNYFAKPDWPAYATIPGWLSLNQTT